MRVAFIPHALDRMKKIGITKEMVLETIKILKKSWKVIRTERSIKGCLVICC